MSSNNENDYKAKLIAVVKKEVKQLMEESVTRKFVHEESGSVTALCGTVEACLSQGLRRRALGLFKTSSTTALLHKIAKHCKEAAIISKKVQEIENSDPNRRSSSSSDSLTKPSSSSSSITTTTSQTATTTTSTSSSSTQTTQSSTTSLKRTSPTLTNLSSLQQQQLPKYLWIRLALFEKQLSKIIDYLVANATKYYDKDALVADPDYGSILSSLLVGPCALDYSHTKTQDHYWTDPPADELVQRHRISSGGHITPPSIRRPILNFRRSLNTSSDDPVSVRNNQHQHLAKDYVESLHQNSRATLLFGKNNVLVLPINAVDITQPIPGYLSLHQTANGLIIKWTPNQLMNGFTSDDCASQQQQQKDQQQQETNVYWDYALQVRLDEIVYVHCHQDSETGGTIILVGQDGVQRPPIHFPRGGHMLAFLSCIETGLLPRGRLDPPLWSQRTNNNNNNNSSNSGNGTKNVTNRKRRPLPALAESEETTTQITKDYVFRIVDNSSHKEILKRNELMDRHISFPNRVRIQLPSTSTSSDSSTKSVSIEQQQSSLITDDNNSPPPTVCIQAVCDSMKRQIISRAFYGWLAYCRHLSTVRTHLSGLVNSKIINGNDNDVKNGITIEKWSELCSNGIVDDDNEVYRLTYFGGIAHDLRKDIWPYLLGHYKFGSTVEQRNELSEETKQAYENTMSEWLAVEAIVRQRDKETQANAIAKLSSESTSGEQPPPTHIPRDLSNDVFEDMSDDDDSAPVIDDTTQHPKRTKQNTIQYESDNDDGENADNDDNADVDDDCTKIDPHAELKDFIHNVIVTNASVDMSNLGGENDTNQRNNNLDAVVEENNSSLDTCIETHGLASPARSACVSPASSNGGVYSQELLETFGLNLHRIEKDVQRCDRNYWYFAGENLDKLRNVMCTYVWEHLDIGYMQGMCDLVAPLLVIFNDESLTYACFCHLMERMVENFPNGNQMDCHFANMRSLIQILDSEMYELMHQQGDYTHFYFCYRWFLLDFKRELIYPDIFTTWEIIWAAQYVSSNHFVLFIALALLETYRDIILSNGMDFTDIIKFFNEMAEHHDAQAVLRLARELVLQLQLLIENK